MSDSEKRIALNPTGDATGGWDHHLAQEDALDEEEKLLAGRHDVNMPALLTRDVKGA